MPPSKFIALAGLGYWGKNVLRDLYNIGVLHTACDSDAATIELRRKDFPEVSYTTSYDQVLDDREITAVAIATPAVTHFEYVKLALEAGKDVYVEKPLALKVVEAEELVALAEERGRILMVGHILRYHPAVIKLKEFIASGRLGRLQYIYSNRLNIGKLRTEENILWSFAPHDISVIMALVGEEPVRVTSMGGDYISTGIMDTTMTTLEFENGVKGHIFVSWLHPFKEQKLVVVGSKCMAVFDDQSADKLVLYPHEIEWKEGRIPVANKAVGESVPLEDKKPLYDELEHFVECVRERKTPLTDGREGLAVLRVLDRAENQLARARSGDTGRQEAEGAGKTDYFVHESACVDDGVTVGRGVKVWHFSHILKGASIGERTIIGQNVMIGADVTIGRGCKVQNNVSVYTGVTLEEEVFCGPSCVFTNVYNPRAFVERKDKFLPTLVKRGAMIGANATIVCGVTIGPYAVIGAGAVVKEDVSAHAVVAGVPAKQTGWACRCGAVLAFDGDSAACGECSNAYRLEGDALLSLEG